jgi:cytochrome c-type biogenesis protein CcmH/NrfG
MGKISYYQKKYGEAETALRQAVTIDPELLDAWLLLVRVSLAQKDYEQAREALLHIRQVTGNATIAKFIDEQVSALGS